MRETAGTPEQSGDGWRQFFLRLEQVIRGLFLTEEIGSTLGRAETILEGAERG